MPSTVWFVGVADVDKQLAHINLHIYRKYAGSFGLMEAAVCLQLIVWNDMCVVELSSSIILHQTVASHLKCFST